MGTVYKFKNYSEGEPVSQNGFVSLWRDIEKQPWYKNSAYKSVFIHLLIRASHSAHKVNFRGCDVNILPGQLVSSITQLERELNLSRDTVRGALKTFEKLGQIATLSVGKGKQKCTVFSVKKWVKFQKNTPTLTPTQSPTLNPIPEAAKNKGLKGDAPTLTPTQSPIQTPIQNNNVLNNNDKNNKKDKAYAFAGETIRINQKDFDKFCQTYSNLDLRAELKQLDLELAGEKKWWPALNAKLNYRNKNAKSKPAQRAIPFQQQITDSNREVLQNFIGGDHD